MNIGASVGYILYHQRQETVCTAGSQQCDAVGYDIRRRLHRDNFIGLQWTFEDRLLEALKLKHEL